MAGKELLVGMKAIGLKYKQGGSLKPPHSFEDGVFKYERLL